MVIRDSMDEMIAFCGLNCLDCEAFIATQAKDHIQLERIAKKWTEQYNTKLSAKDILCDGCQSLSDQLCVHCDICEIRRCGQKKKLDNCSRCDDYPCDRLDSFFQVAPQSREALEILRAKYRI